MCAGRGLSMGCRVPCRANQRLQVAIREHQRQDLWEKRSAFAPRRTCLSQTRERCLPFVAFEIGAAQHKKVRAPLCRLPHSADGLRLFSSFLLLSTLLTPFMPPVEYHGHVNITATLPHPPSAVFPLFDPPPAEPAVDKGPPSLLRRSLAQPGSCTASALLALHSAVYACTHMPTWATGCSHHRNTSQCCITGATLLTRHGPRLPRVRLVLHLGPLRRALWAPECMVRACWGTRGNVT